MILSFTLKNIYSGSRYIAGPFNISGTTDTGEVYELAQSISKSQLLSGYILETQYNITGGTIESTGFCKNSISWAPILPTPTVTPTQTSTPTNTPTQTPTTTLTSTNIPI